MKQIIMFLTLLLTSACHPNTKSVAQFERQTELFKYFDCANIKVDENINHVFIFQTNKCGACTDEVLDYVGESYKSNEENKIFILCSKNNLILNTLKPLKNSKIHIDSNFDLERYGLSYATDLYVKLNNHKIEYWAFLDHKTVSSLLKSN